MSARPGGGRVDLVLEGGGVKGIALAGALEVLAERGYTVNRVAGTSSGAIAGGLVACGVPPAALVEVLRGTDYRAFLDGPWWTRTLLGKALAVLRRSGVHPGDRLVTWFVEQRAAHAPGGGAETFGELRYEDPDGLPAGGPPYRLVVTAADLTAGRLRHLPTDAALLGEDPDALPVVDAVRASMSIPVLFRPVRRRTPAGHEAWLVDGGVLSNFPVEVFDRPDGQEPRWPTFGIKLSARPAPPDGPVHRIRGPLSFGRALVDTVMGFHDRQHIDADGTVERTIFVDTTGIRATRFGLTAAEQEDLFARGRAAAERFLDGDARHEAWDFARYVRRHRSTSTD